MFGSAPAVARSVVASVGPGLSDHDAVLSLSVTGPVLPDVLTLAEEIANEVWRRTGCVVDVVAVDSTVRVVAFDAPRSVFVGGVLREGEVGQRWRGLGVRWATQADRAVA